MTLHRLSLAELRAGLRRREFSSEELVQSFLDRIDRFNPGLNALVTVTAEEALAAARAADRRFDRGIARSLDGIPLVHKDNLCTRGVRTSCGSRMLDGFVAPYDGAVVERLAEAGAVMVGKANMDQFAMGSSGETSFYGPTRNPWNPDVVPGGSSGGSSAAVAARLAPAATGTDTGGSIRQPAALCGISGLKPTYGLVSRHGLVGFASSFDQVGPMAASAEDLAWLLGAMAGFDERDSTSVDRPVPDYVAGLDDASIAGLRIGLPRQFFGDLLDPAIAVAVREAVGVFERLGATVADVDLPRTDLAVPAYYVITSAEGSSNLSRFDGVRYGHRCDSPRDLQDLYERSRSEGFGAEVKRRIMIGTHALLADQYETRFIKAQQLRRLIRDDFAQVLSEVDVIMGPAAPEVAFPVGFRRSPETVYHADSYTVGVNLAGLPAMSIPCGIVGGLPVGLQLVGTFFSEAGLLGIAHRFQQETDWHHRIPESCE